MGEFQIRIEAPAWHDPFGPGRLSIRLGESYLTRLVRRGSHKPDDCLEAPPVPLAFWFVDNWWRTRSEPPPQSDLDAEWRLAHHLSSVGAGYHWPNVSIRGEGSRFGVAVHADAGNLQPGMGCGTHRHTARDRRGSARSRQPEQGREHIPAVGPF